DEVLAACRRYCIQRGHSAIRMIEAAATALTAAEPPSDKWAHEGTDVDWYDVLGVLPVAMYLSVLPSTPPEQREALLVLLEVYANSGLSAPGGRLREVTLEADRKTELKPGSVVPIGSRRLLVTTASGTDVTGLEYAPDGQFGPLPGFSITGEEPMELPAGAG